VCPVFDPCDPDRDRQDRSPDGSRWWHYVSESKATHLSRTFNFAAKDILAAWLPRDWCDLIGDDGAEWPKEMWAWRVGWYGYRKTRRGMEDAAALAFLKLPDKRRAQLLAGAEAQAA